MIRTMFRVLFLAVLLAGCGSGGGTAGRAFNTSLAAPDDLKGRWENPNAPAIVLSWSNRPAGAEFFVVERRTEDETEFRVIADGVTADQVSFADHDVDKLKEYVYRVSSRNADGDSQPSSEVVVVYPLITCNPTLLGAIVTAPEPTTILARWAETCTNEEGFRIELYKQPGLDFVTSVEVLNPTDDHTFNDGISPSTSYVLRFTAFNELDEVLIDDFPVTTSAAAGSGSAQ